MDTRKDGSDNFNKLNGESSVFFFSNFKSFRQLCGLCTLIFEAQEKADLTDAQQLHPRRSTKYTVNRHEDKFQNFSLKQIELFSVNRCCTKKNFKNEINIFK